MEGYRVYRGRVDNPSELPLLAQFDYAPDAATGKGIFMDFRGLVNPIRAARPSSRPPCSPTCDPALQPPPPPGTPFTPGASVEHRPHRHGHPGDPGQPGAPGQRRRPGAAGQLDTAFADVAAGPGGPGCQLPTLANTGVPFIFVDRGVRNSLRYFYSVTAFDVNSLVSGPSSLESARVTKAVTPTPAVSNDTDRAWRPISGRVRPRRARCRRARRSRRSTRPTGRSAAHSRRPTAATCSWAPLVPSIVGTEGAAAARLDSITLGSAYAVASRTSTGSRPAALGFDPATSTVISLPILQPEETGVTDRGQQLPGAAGGGRQGGQVRRQAAASCCRAISEFNLVGPDYLTLPGRGCVNARAGFGDGPSCNYNGSRWFLGPSPTTNETVADPIAGNTANFSGAPMTNFNNAGGIAGVTTIFQAQCYYAAPGGRLPRARRASCPGPSGRPTINVYWGEGGVVDSVIDVDPQHPGALQCRRISGTWGILNPGAQTGTPPDGSATLTELDFACVEPFRTYAVGPVRLPRRQRRPTR